MARYFGGDAPSWLSLQTAYDLRVAGQQALAAIEKEVLPRGGGLSFSCQLQVLRIINLIGQLDMTQ